MTNLKHLKQLCEKATAAIYWHISAHGVQWKKNPHVIQVVGEFTEAASPETISALILSVEEMSTALEQFFVCPRGCDPCMQVASEALKAHRARFQEDER